MKVNCSASYAHNVEGVITYLSAIDGRAYADIEFNVPTTYGYRDGDGFWLDDLQPLNLTPEEQAQFDETRRFERECILNQECRKKHADKYL